MAKERELEVKHTLAELSDLIALGVGAAIGYFGGVLGAVTGAYAGLNIAKKLKGPGPRKYHSSHWIFKDIKG
jgi:hypothetical protein